MTKIDTRDWALWAVRVLRTDMQRSADTNLIRVDLCRDNGITLYLKDETTHPTGSLKHRLARSMFMQAVCSGHIGPDTVIVEASSGSTAVSEAYFAAMLGLRFIAVVPRSTTAEKLGQIRVQGGECHLVDHPAEVYDAARALAARHGGWYMDQFTYAERVTDWRGDDNIAASIFRQMAKEDRTVPDWVICGAGTGGTLATIGRHVRYHGLSTRLCLADPQSSIFHRTLGGDYAPDRSECTSLVEGIGRGRMEPSFLPDLIDRAIAVPDVLSIAAARVLSRRLGRLCGGSTGTNLVATAVLASDLMRRGTGGALVTILCDSGERYLSTIYNDDWLRRQAVDTSAAEAALEDFLFRSRPVSFDLRDVIPGGTAAGDSTREVA